MRARRSGRLHLIHFIQFNHNYLNRIFIRLDVVVYFGGGDEGATYSDTIAVVTDNRVTGLGIIIIVVVTANLSCWDGLGFLHVGSTKW